MNTKPAANPIKKPIIAKTTLNPSTLETCFSISTGNKSTPSHPEAAPDNTNKISAKISDIYLIYKDLLIE